MYVTHGDDYQENVYVIVIKKMCKLKFKIKIILPYSNKLILLKKQQTRHLIQLSKAVFIV